MTLQVFSALLRPGLPEARVVLPSRAAVIPLDATFMSDIEDDTAIYAATGIDGNAGKRRLTNTYGDDGLKINKPPKSSSRMAWEILHRLFGFAIIGLSCWQCSTGLSKYQDATAQPLFPAADTCFTTAIIGFLSVTMILYYVQTTARRLYYE